MRRVSYTFFLSALHWQIRTPNMLHFEESPLGMSCGLQAPYKRTCLICIQEHASFTYRNMPQLHRFTLHLGTAGSLNLHLHILLWWCCSQTFKEACHRMCALMASLCLCSLLRCLALKPQCRAARWVCTTLISPRCSLRSASWGESAREERGQGGRQLPSRAPAPSRCLPTQSSLHIKVGLWIYIYFGCSLC